MDLDASGQRLDTDGVKLYCTTMGKNVADRAMQVPLLLTTLPPNH